MTEATSANGNERAEQGIVVGPIDYDPFDHGLTVLHRAGIAGLYLQIRSLEILREEMSEAGAAPAVPQYDLIHEGRGIRVVFTRATFYSLMRERYRGTLVDRIVGKQLHKARQKPKKKTKRFEFVKEIDPEKFLYRDPKPLLRYFELFKAHKDWQAHAASACFGSYYSIPLTQPIFKLPSEDEGSNKIDELWNALVNNEKVKLDKPIYPCAFSKNLKGTLITEDSRLALLLHFWPLVTAHFIPINLKADKDKTGKKFLRYDWQRPVVVVPDIVDTDAFVESFIEHLGTLGDGPSGRVYDDGRYIATPLEAALAFFAAPRLARGVRNKVGTRGAEVYVFKQRPKLDKQPLVTAIVNESFELRLVNEYRTLMEKGIQSVPFRAICVENLVAQPRRYMYEGFERLVEQYPLELFVALKTEGTRRFRKFGSQMAKSLFHEFRMTQEKERRKMNGKKSIPSLVWQITSNYVRWRACAKAEPPMNEIKLSTLQEKVRTKQQLDDGENAVLAGYNKAVGDVVEKLFIDFRGYREREAFANAFTETLFRAPQDVGPEVAADLQPFIEGKDDWESGRRLVLMAISAAGANASETIGDDVAAVIPESEANEPEETE
jgi:CRISPR-associated protein Cmx8